jgi:molecular chaperone GrpE
MSDAPIPPDDETAVPGDGPIAEWDQDQSASDITLVLPAETVEVIATESYPLPLAVGGMPVEEGGGVLKVVRRLEDALTARLDALQAAFDREIRAEATREKVVDRLHAELQAYKGDLLLQTLRPIFVDLIQLHDDIGKIVDSQSAESEGQAARLLDFMRGFQQGIEDILYRQGVEPFEAEGESFDPRRQRAVATVPTDEPGRARTVAQRHRKGFRAGEKIIRPEIVSVFAERR